MTGVRIPTITWASAAGAEARPRAATLATSKLRNMVFSLKFVGCFGPLQQDNAKEQAPCAPGKTASHPFLICSLSRRLDDSPAGFLLTTVAMRRLFAKITSCRRLLRKS